MLIEEMSEKEFEKAVKAGEKVESPEEHFIADYKKLCDMHGYVLAGKIVSVPTNHGTLELIVQLYPEKIQR